jgi:hypothetical protein
MRGGEPPLPSEQAAGREELLTELAIEPWIDPLVEAHGFGPRSPYVEVCWLPVLGPTATWLYRRLGSWVEIEDETVPVDLADLSVSLGIGQGLGRHSPLMRSLGRLAQFHVARWQGSALGVRRSLPLLPERQAARLSPSAYRFHQQLRDGPRPAPGRATGRAE